MRNQFTGFIVALIIAVMGSTATVAQSRPPLGTGVFFQVYPEGFIPGLKGAIELTFSDVVILYTGLNFSDRGSWALQDNEKGHGIGFGLAWHHYWVPRRQGWFFGARTDLWFLDIDWKTDSRPVRSGTTEVTVLQPTAQIGHTWMLLENRVAFNAMASLGFKLNVHTSGRPVRQGVAMLAGISMSRRF